MAVKNSYKIPTSLDRSMLDHEISLGGSFGNKVLSLKSILFWGSSILILFWSMRTTFISDASFIWVTLYFILWIILTGFLGKYNKTKEMNFKKVPVFAEYFPRRNRRVVTRSSSNPSGFYSISLIEKLDNSGLITWVDGSVGQMYRVVGSASILVFEEDKKMILNRVDSFFRKIDTNIEMSFVTMKEPQRVFHQLAHLERMNKDLKDRDPELVELMHERFDILRDYVGTEFSSIHQYLVIKGDNLEALRKAHTVLSAEVDDSSLMIKHATMLDGKETQEVLSSLYGGVLQ